LTPRTLLALALALVAGTTGCQPSFRANGNVSSAGPAGKDNWRSAPQGCTRDAFDGLPPDKTRSIVTFLWEDPGMREPKMQNWWVAPDSPMRLEFSRADSGPGISATLHTRYKAGIPLDPAVCGTFRLQTYEQLATAPATRPSLSGELALDCRVEGNHINASVRFEHCEY
jgi:hypothetical protein